MGQGEGCVYSNIEITLLWSRVFLLLLKRGRTWITHGPQNICNRWKKECTVTPFTIIVTIPISSKIFLLFLQLFCFWNRSQGVDPSLGPRKRDVVHHHDPSLSYTISGIWGGEVDGTSLVSEVTHRSRPQFPNYCPARDFGAPSTDIWNRGRRVWSGSRRWWKGKCRKGTFDINWSWKIRHFRRIRG